MIFQRTANDIRNKPVGIVNVTYFRFKNIFGIVVSDFVVLAGFGICICNIISVSIQDFS